MKPLPSFPLMDAEKVAETDLPDVFELYLDDEIRYTALGCQLEDLAFRVIPIFGVLGYSGVRWYDPCTLRTRWRFQKSVSTICCEHCEKMGKPFCPIKAASPWRPWENFCSDFVKKEEVIQDEGTWNTARTG